MHRLHFLSNKAAEANAHILIFVLDSLPIGAKIGPLLGFKKGL